MAGTVSIVYPVAGQTKEDWTRSTFAAPYLYEIGKTEIPGIAYGWTDSEISFSRQTMHKARPFLLVCNAGGEMLRLLVLQEIVIDTNMVLVQTLKPAYSRKRHFLHC